MIIPKNILVYDKIFEVYSNYLKENVLPIKGCYKFTVGDIDYFISYRSPMNNTMLSYNTQNKKIECSSSSEDFQKTDKNKINSKSLLQIYRELLYEKF